MDKLQDEDFGNHKACCCEHAHDHDACGSHDDHDGCDNHKHHHSHNQHESGNVQSHHVEGHPQDCDCPLCHPHVEYCDVCGESLAACTCSMPDDGLEKSVYILQGLDCANCAAKIEAKVRTMPEVAFASVTFASKQLRISSAEKQEVLLPKMQALIDSVEDGVTLVPRKRKGNVGVSKTKVYILQGLDCPNCALKIERNIKDLPGVDDVSITYANLQMRLSAARPDVLIPDIQKLIDSLEDGITLVSKKQAEKEAKQEEAQQKHSFISEEKKPIVAIVLGAIIFLIGFCLIYLGGFAENDLRLLPIFIVAYLVLGGSVLKTAGRNILKGQIFDENFLMCIATLGAFGIQEYPEAVGVMLFYRIGEYFEHRATEQSRSQIMDAVDLRPEVVNLVIGDEVRTIDADEAIVGDIVLVRPGDRIPLDGVVIEGESRLDTSAITGEPVPVKVEVGDLVDSGCVNTSGQLKVRVEKVLEESMVTRILDSVENAAASKPEVDKFITRFAHVYTPIVCVIALLVALVSPLLPFLNWTYLPHTGASSSVLTALTFLVISCPCALVLSVPLAFFSGIGAASKKNILFKGGVVIESMRNIKAVVMDKTGTITQGNFVVQDVISALPNLTSDEVLSLCASCELSSTHPIGTSVVAAAKARNLNIEHPLRVEEIAGYGIRAEISRGVLLCGNRKLMEANGVDLSAYACDTFGTEVFLALNGSFAGNVLIADTIKDDAVKAIARIKKMGVVTAMLTGDAQESAEAVAAKAGIDEVHARLLPEDKLIELQKIRKQHGVVMFVGDGINDAPVLAGADVGAAMGSGADAAIEAADVVFMTSEMSAIPEALDIARATNRITWQNVYFALGVKAIVMVLGLMGFANMWFAVFADTGVAMLCLLNSFRILRRK